MSTDNQNTFNKENLDLYLKELGKESFDFVDLLIPIKFEFTNDEYINLVSNELMNFSKKIDIKK